MIPRTRKRLTRRRLCLVTPTKPSRDFFTKVVDEFAAQAEEVQYDFILKVPRGDYDTGHSVAIVTYLCDELDKRDILVLIPAREHAHYPPLGDLLRRQAHCTVMTFDLPLRVNTETLPCAKGADEIGGETAAKAALWYLSSLKLKRKARIIMLRGLWGHSRAAAFSQALASAAAPIIDTLDCDWDMEAAYRGLMHHLTLSPSEEVDLVFCCNDEMALGARLAILEARRQIMTPARFTKVIGFDGTDLVRYLLRSGEDIIINSVDVNIRGQVLTAMNVLARLEAGRSALQENDRISEIPPRGLLLSEEEQKGLSR
jgi:ABC-type sugar transport system substrate-binding protein